MSNRAIDQSKPANRKCEHCGNFQFAIYSPCKCLLTGKNTNYWQKCKDFAWDETKKYKQKGE